MFDWFISDTHFGHAAIIDVCFRPFNTVEEMNEGIVENFNSVVSNTDRVLWCGDVSFVNKARTKAIFDRLKGSHWLVRGNHDSRAGWFMDVGFELVTDSLTFRMDDWMFVASHFPYRKHFHDSRFELLDRHPNRGSEDFLLHGHTHSLAKTCSNMIHVGIDAWDMFPASRDEILTIVKEKLNG